MAEFLGTPLASVVLLLALTGVLIVVGVYVIGKVRSGLNTREPGASVWLTKFRDLYSQGQLSDEEFRTIKANLSKRLEHELNDTNKPG
jgi:hypothetical protein